MFVKRIAAVVERFNLDGVDLGKLSYKGYLMISDSDQWPKINLLFHFTTFLFLFLILFLRSCITAKLFLMKTVKFILVFFSLDQDHDCGYPYCRFEALQIYIIAELRQALRTKLISYTFPANRLSIKKLTVAFLWQISSYS